MREIRLSGSEGGGITFPLPLSGDLRLTAKSAVFASGQGFKSSPPDPVQPRRQKQSNPSASGRMPELVLKQAHRVSPTSYSEVIR